jgi:hypothetical protein
MGEQEMEFGERLAEALWPPAMRVRRDVTSITFISKSSCAVLAGEAVARRTQGKKVDAQAANAARVLLKDIGAVLDSGTMNDELAEGARALAGDLEKVAVPLPATGIETDELPSVDVLAGIASAALAVSAQVSDRQGCFGPLPKRRGCF